LRDRFLGAVAAGLDFVAEFPEAARVVRGDVRRKPLPTFPYALLYTIREREIRIPRRSSPAEAPVLLGRSKVEGRAIGRWTSDGTDPDRILRCPRPPSTS